MVTARKHIMIPAVIALYLPHQPINQPVEKKKQVLHWKNISARLCIHFKEWDSGKTLSTKSDRNSLFKLG